MGKSFKKIFLSSARKIILLFFGLGVSGVLLLPQPAFAQFWDRLLGGLNFIPYNIINIFFQFVLLLSSALAALAGTLLKWVLSPGFVSWGYIDNNPIVDIGLNITKSFVNMGLVLVLIFIAFGIILRLKEYEAKKTLTSLIIVALLVNFAPVICGFVVDATNIAMYYFTDNLTGMLNLTNVLKSSADNIAAGIRTLRASEQFGALFQTTVMIAFSFTTFFILMVYALLFLFRYVAIWTAVILAPLAFVSRILPSTRKFWDNWWKQFSQWCIIGIPAAFFLYLGERIASLAQTVKIEGMAEEHGWMDPILPHFVTLAFLIMGLMTAFSTSAWGANRIAKGGKNFGKTAGPIVTKWMGRIPTNVYKTPGRTVKWASQNYRIARERGASRSSAFKKTAKQTWEQTGIGAYQIAKQRGSATQEDGQPWSRRKSFMGAAKKTGQAFTRTIFGPQPPQGYIAAANQGIKDAWKRSWKAGIKGIKSGQKKEEKKS